MKRRAPMPPRTKRIPRTSVLAQHKPIKKRNPKRQAKEFARTYGSQDRKDWITDHPCLVCYRFPTENAHVKGGGGSRKGDADTVIPLCHFHHIETLHRIGVAPFERLYALELSGLTLLEWAARYDAAYEAFTRGTELTPLSAIVPGVVARLLDDNAS